MKSLFLRPEREKSLYRRHPWIFSGAAARCEGDPQAGETLAVRDSQGRFLAWAAYSPQSQICARVWSWDEAEQIDEAFFRRRLQQAIAARQPFLSHWNSDALRLAHGESDGLPGLVVDRYGDTLVAQFLSCGAERHRDLIADLLMEISGAARLYERSDVEVRRLEGLPERAGLLRGDEPPERILIHENGLEFWVNVRRGHKTGHYLDQGDNRQHLRSFAQGRRVLDCFCYTGGFSVYAVAGGAASVLAIDASAEGLALAGENLALNHLPSDRVDFQPGDVFQVLRGLRDRRAAFDLIVLDPPKFAPTSAQAERAARGYKDINLLAFKLLSPGGLLVTFSCSGGISAELFQKIVADAALDAGVGAQIIERLAQRGDHPVALNFPEGAYLKGLVVQRTSAGD